MEQAVRSRRSRGGTAWKCTATTKLRQDVVTIHPTTNTVILNTESYDRLTKYLNIKSPMVNGQEHEVASYSVPNCDTCKGIVYIDRCALRYKPKTTLPKVDKTPPSPNTKPALPTKKQEHAPKKKADEDWPSLAAPPSNKSSPAQDAMLRLKHNILTPSDSNDTQAIRSSTFAVRSTM
ncbi:hypothetical protein HPB52_021491 [Rhipicephalus sanguineus]|uniref:Uncharacterized protein n=1 Tax=Rhipicephalus sanguineus TaxID=34632 RepID=A0A9D4T7Z0_RHISA|nr:hypothetical protein HPB52_021491 [Rhipicephalus sanguineus]